LAAARRLLQAGRIVRAEGAELIEERRHEKIWWAWSHDACHATRVVTRSARASGTVAVEMSAATVRCDSFIAL
jgi:hypothetical protein